MQHITHLEIKDSYKNIKKGFVWENIPQFAVVTGENGSGKSSLLQGIKEGKFFVNHQQGLKATMEFLNNFSLQGHGYNPSFIKEINHEESLLSKYITETSNDTANIFSRVLQGVKQYSYLAPITSELTFENFVLRKFSSYTEEQQNFLNGWRNALNLEIYHKHFERNGMSEEKFYLSTYNEIKQWISNLEDKNFTSRKTIFDENALASIFGNYYIRKNNKKDDIEDSNPNIAADKRDELIEKEIGVNPLTKINQLLKQVYSKYTLGIRVDDNNQPKIICKDKNGTSVSLNELSTGEQIIISLYMWRYDKNPLHSTIFLFDEPDAHLNPKMAKMLIDILKNVIVKEFGCQVIMTTHSLSTVAYCEEKDLFYMEEGKVSKISKEECIQNLADGVMTFERALNQLKLIENSNKPILVVEGKTEKIIFEKYYKFKKQEMPFIVIDGKGADNLPQFCTCFNVMNLPQKRVFLFDYDEKGIENFKKIKTNKNIAKLYVKSEQEMSEYQKQAKTFTIEKIFPFSIVQKYYEMGKELVKMSVGDFINGLSKKMQEQYSDFFKEQDSDECLYKIVDSKDVEKRKTDFASNVFDFCKECDLQELEKLISRIESEFFKE